jgi:hypothetical protein
MGFEMKDRGIKEVIELIAVVFILICIWKVFLTYADEFGIAVYILFLGTSIYATYLIVILWCDHDLVVRKGIE